MKKPSTLRIFGTAVVVMVATVTIIGLYIAGSPGQERDYRLDEQRVTDLQQIASSVDLYYEQHGSLPENLDLLTEERQARNYYIRSVTDPETDMPYEYSITSDTAYSLCASFVMESREPEEHLRQVYMGVKEEWGHDAGSYCFDLDAELRTLRNFCGLRKPCEAGQSCVTLPDMEEAVCVQEGQECRAARCPEECVLAESYPMQVMCIDPETGEPMDAVDIEDVLEEPME